MLPSAPEARMWPLRLSQIAKELQSPPDESSRDRIHEEIWTIVYLALSLYLQSHASRFGGVAREDLEDLAAEKSLVLVRRIVTGMTEVADRSPAEIRSFLSKVARNDLVDLMRKQGRRVDLAEESRPGWESDGSGMGGQVTMIDPPDILVERKEFALALRRCAEQLNPRSRLVWFLRVFYEMSSKQIAFHPRIRLRTSHVDALLHRSRKMMRDCMQRQGFRPQDMPPGTFIELWKAFHLETADGQGE